MRALSIAMIAAAVFTAALYWFVDSVKADNAKAVAHADSTIKRAMAETYPRCPPFCAGGYVPPKE